LTLVNLSSGDEVELHFLSSIETTIAILLDCRVMNEDIFAIILEIKPYPLALLNHFTFPLAMPPNLLLDLRWEPGVSELAGQQ